MSQQSALEAEIAILVVETLNLEDVEPGSIDPDEGLFDGELALDSVDALEIPLALSQKYSVQLKAEDEDTREAFRTIRTLGEFVATNQSA